jgi:hypothetical protein
MNRFLGTLALTAFALTACGGGTGTGSSIPAPQGAGPATAAAAPALSPDQKRKKKHHLIPIHFFIKLPKTKHRKHPKRGAHYIPSTAASVQVTLNTVQGGNTPPAGLLTEVTTNLTSSCSSGCTVNGPSVPPGVDNLSIIVLDASSNILSEATSDFTITIGTANSLSLTLLGVPSSVDISTLPSGTAGTAFSSSPFNIDVLDADGNSITGAYSSPVTVTDADTSATTIAMNGGTPGTSVISTKSYDTFVLNYSGLAIVPAQLTASATTSNVASAYFSPSVSNPTSVCNGAGGGDTTECSAGPQINLYATSGTGSTASFTTSQTGWSESPFLQTFTESDNCSSIATISSSDNLTFTATVVGSPSVGTCDVTLTGGGPSLNDSEQVEVTYTTSGIGVDARHANPKHHTKP